MKNKKIPKIYRAADLSVMSYAYHNDIVGGIMNDFSGDG